MAKSTKDIKPKKTKAKTTAKVNPADSLIVPNHTFTLVIKAEAVAKAKDKVLLETQKTIKLDGFRQGKAPLKIVAERLGATGLQELILREVLPSAYREHLQANQLKPLTEPEVTPKSIEEGKDWEFTVAIAETQPLELGEYQAIVKGIKEPDHHEHDGHKHTADELLQLKLQAILRALLEKIQVKVPELLLRQETEHRFGQLIQQLKQVNLELADYLKNIKKTQEELYQEYAVNTLASLQIELLLAAIVSAAQLKVEEKELEAVITARLANQPKKKGVTREELNYWHSTLLKQKAIAHLLSL